MSLFETIQHLETYRSGSIMSQISDLSDRTEHKTGPYLEGNLKLQDTM
jgi:hypothetical protein